MAKQVRLDRPLETYKPVLPMFAGPCEHCYCKEELTTTSPGPYRICCHCGDEQSLGKSYLDIQGKRRE